MIAIEAQHTEATRLLIDANADYRIRNYVCALDDYLAVRSHVYSRCIGHIVISYNGWCSTEWPHRVGYRKL